MTRWLMDEDGTPAHSVGCVWSQQDEESVTHKTSQARFCSFAWISVSEKADHKQQDHAASYCAGHNHGAPLNVIQALRVRDLHTWAVEKHNLALLDDFCKAETCTRGSFKLSLT